MSGTIVQERSIGFKVGYGILLFFAVANVFGHIGLLLFDPGPDTIFLGWAAFNLQAASILLIPYRHGEKWAWYTIWAMIVPYALIILFNAEIGPSYLVEAGLMALGQILTYSVFFPRATGASQSE